MVYTCFLTTFLALFLFRGSPTCVCVCVCARSQVGFCFCAYVFILLFVCVCVCVAGGCTQHKTIVGSGMMVHGLLRGLFLWSGEGPFICFAQH